MNGFYYNNTFISINPNLIEEFKKLTRDTDESVIREFQSIISTLDENAPVEQIKVAIEEELQTQIEDLG